MVYILVEKKKQVFDTVFYLNHCKVSIFKTGSSQLTFAATLVGKHRFRLEKNKRAV